MTIVCDDTRDNVCVCAFCFSSHYPARGRYSTAFKKPPFLSAALSPSPSPFHVCIQTRVHTRARTRTRACEAARTAPPPPDAAVRVFSSRGGFLRSVLSFRLVAGAFSSGPLSLPRAATWLRASYSRLGIPGVSFLDSPLSIGANENNIFQEQVDL